MAILRVVLKIIGVWSLIILLSYVGTVIGRHVIYDNVGDPIVPVVAKELGDEGLVLGSRLVLWYDKLGKPDIVSNEKKFIYKYTKLYWINHGIGVEVRGHMSGNNMPSGRKKVRGVLIPLNKRLYEKYPRMSPKVDTDSRDNENEGYLKFMDARVGGKPIKDLKHENLLKLYKYYDGSDDNYFDMIFPFTRHSARYDWDNRELGIYDASWFNIDSIWDVVRIYLFFPFFVLGVIMEWLMFGIL